MSIPQRIRIEVHGRDGARCVRCGSAGPLNIHHRTPRGMGGSKDPKINSIANLVTVCGSGTTGCHGWIESHREQAYAQGWLVHRGADPELIPVIGTLGFPIYLGIEVP